MKTTIVLMLLAITQCYHTTAKITTTMKISERIKILKKQIRNSLRNPSPESHEPIPSYYESAENAPIRPILDNDELKKDDRYRLKKIKTPATTPKPLLRTQTGRHSQQKRLLNILHRYKLTRTRDVPKALTQMAPVPYMMNETTSKVGLSIFYRRYDKYILENTQEWMHCSEHVTPYLKGAKKELTRPRKVQEKDHIVHRLMNLLKANTTRMTRAEKKTTMYQISKLRIRLYSWDLGPVTDLVSLITRQARSAKVDFLSLKRGLINLLASWQADLSNTTTLLYQAKIFRPPCIPRGTPGSSKFVRGSTMSSPSTPLRFMDSVECRRSGGRYGCV